MVQRVEFLRLGKMREVARVENEIRRGGQSIDLGDDLLERADNIGIGWLVKPMWLSLICTKLKSPTGLSAAAALAGLNIFEASTPPRMVHNIPVPAQAMHFKKPRRSTPSFSGLWSRWPASAAR